MISDSWNRRVILQGTKLEKKICEVKAWKSTHQTVSLPTELINVFTAGGWRSINTITKCCFNTSHIQCLMLHHPKTVASWLLISIFCLHHFPQYKRVDLCIMMQVNIHYQQLLLPNLKIHMNDDIYTTFKASECLVDHNTCSPCYMLVAGVKSFSDFLVLFSWKMKLTFTAWAIIITRYSLTSIKN